MSDTHCLMAFKHFYCVGKDVTRQTLQESKIDHSIDMGLFSIHHGSRYGSPIVIVERHQQGPGELSAVWFDVSLGDPK
jgi:hypothetical protein